MVTALNSSSPVARDSIKKKFLAPVHSFRAIAIVAVVATHVTDELDWGNASRLVRDGAYSIFQNGSVLFMFVAGFLFQYLAGRFRYHRYLLGKLKNVIIPYILMSFPEIAHQYIRGYGIFQVPGSKGHVLSKVVVALATAGHMPRPLWFVPMIAVFYLLAPVLILVDRHPRWYWPVPALCILSGFIHRPVTLNHTLHSCGYFLSSYLAGMCLGRYHEPILAKLATGRMLGGLVVLLAGLFALETMVLGRGGAVFSDLPFGNFWIFDFNQIAKLVSCLVLLGLLTQASPRVHARLEYLAGASFGVFFLHGYIIKILLKLHRGAVAGGIASLLLLTTAVVALSALLVFVVRKATGRWSRQVVGC